MEADLLAVVRRHVSAFDAHLVASALIELTGSVCGDLVRAMPDARADLDRKLTELRLFVASEADPDLDQKLGAARLFARGTNQAVH